MQIVAQLGSFTVDHITLYHCLKRSDMKGFNSWHKWYM
jgi:hypothetical protein